METLSLRFGLRGETISVEAEKTPRTGSPWDQVLPGPETYRRPRHRHGHQKSAPNRSTCAKGCSMCCQIQLVPVSPAEAYALLLLLESLPEPRRTQIMETVLRPCGTP